MKKVLSSLLILGTTISLVACSSTGNKADSLLEKGNTYFGTHTTDEIIVVDSNDSWTIKNSSMDDSNYTVVSVTETGDKIEDYPIVELKAKEVVGDIDSSFAKREGRKFIIAKDGNDVFFRSISEDNLKGVTGKLEESEDDNEVIKDLANYFFTMK